MSDKTEDSSVRAQVAAWLADGTTASEVEQRLCQRGMTPSDAAGLVDEVLAEVLAAAAAATRRQDRADLLRGGLWCLGGLALLAAGLGLASSGAAGRLPGGSGFALYAASAAAIGRGILLIVRVLA